MDKLIGDLLKWPWVINLRSPNNDDEHVDRLNHRVTVGLILCCAFITGTSAFVNSRMSCWVPAELRHDSYPKYIEHYCWISNTYYVHTNVTPPNSDEERRLSQISYYQWMPILLLLMALGFYAPRLFWRSFNVHHGIDIQNLIKKSETVSKASTKIVAEILDSYCQTFTQERSRNAINLPAYVRRKKHRGNYLLSIYFLTRCMYLVNSVLQLILLNALLGHRGTAWFLDIDIMKSILRYGNPLLDSPYFPRVALCDVPIREIAEIHRYTIQCALPVNILNEKVFLALSFWFSYVIIHNICSFVIFVSQLFPSRQHRYVKHLSKLKRSSHAAVHIDEFTSNYLTYDGVFLLRLISHNSSDLQAIEVLETMLDKYDRTEDRHG